MEENVRQLWTYAHGIIGACVGGFLFLAKWAREQDKRVDAMDKRVDAMDNKVEQTITIQKDIKEIFNSIKVIEGVIVGDYKNKGLLTKHDDLSLKVDGLASRFEEHLRDK